MAFCRHRSLPPGLAPSPAAPRTLAGILVAGAVVAGLTITNPGPAEFEAFAAERLTEVITEELCSDDGLPMMMRLIIPDCPGLVGAQHAVLGRLARQHTRRRNLMVMSVYMTDLGGQQVLPGWRLPRYSAVTLAAAGRFLLVHSEETDPGAIGP